MPESGSGRTTNVCLTGAPTGHACSQMNATALFTTKKGNKFLRIITNKPRRRLSIPISPNVKISRTIELVRDSGKFYLHIPQQIKMKALQNIPKTSPSRQQRNRKTKYCVALDSGFTEVFVDDRGNFYGSDFGKITTATAIEIDEKIRKRNKLLSVLSKTSDCKKRHHILKYNLRTKKLFAEAKKHKLRLRTYIDQSIYKLFRTNPADVYLVESLSRNFEPLNKSRRLNLLLTTWRRGLVAERLELLAFKHNVDIVHIPASYTSQRCPHCSYVHKKNRKGNIFKCQHCQHTGHADRNAALNILLAAHDVNINRSLSKSDIDTIYRNEYLSYCQTHQQQPMIR